MSLARAPSPCANYPGLDRRSGTSPNISCEAADWQVSHMAQVFSQFSLSMLFDVARLGLEASTVQTLPESWRLAGPIALVLEDNSEEMTSAVLPCPELIRLQDQPA